MDLTSLASTLTLAAAAAVLALDGITGKRATKRGQITRILLRSSNTQPPARTRRTTR